MSRSPETWMAVEGDRAFDKAVRARRRAAVARRLRRGAECARLAIHEAQAMTRANAPRGLRDIPLEAITASVEPNRAADFDKDFRPSPGTRNRWVSVWKAEQRGTVLPPISVTAVGDSYAIRDGHHRVSVARARGAVSITALIA
jgi:hypothetical protein